MNARTASLLAVVIMACTEEGQFETPDTLPITTLDFQSRSMTIVEGTPEHVMILTNEGPQGPTRYS